MEDFRTALPRLEQIKSTQAALHWERLEDEKQLEIQKSVKSSQHSFRRLLLVFFVGVVFIGLLVAIVTVFYAIRVRQTQEELRILYETSLRCLQDANYVCARDGFQALETSGAEFPGLDQNINEAQYGLARQYFDSGQWENAVEELNVLLQRDPGNQMAVDLLRASYDRWIDQLGLEGKIFQRWIVRRQRDARFPPGED